MRMLNLAIVAGAMALTFAGAADAQRGPSQWRVIGFKVVNGGTDTDTIYTPGRWRFRQLRLCAYQAPLRLRDFDVFYANGSRQDVRTRERVAPDSCTRVIDLDGRDRDIARIRLRYEPIARGMRPPLVRVSGR